MQTLYRFRFLAALLAFGLVGCRDNCQQTVTYRTQRQFFISSADLRSGIKTLDAQVMEKPGKLYVRGTYLFINELKKGIHLIDNANPSAPREVSFLAIPGNTDMAVRGNVLYADSYIDLLAFDISDPLNARLLKRVENAFPSGSVDGLHWQFDQFRQQVVDTRWETVTEVRDTDCENSNGGWSGGWGGRTTLQNSVADRGFAAGPSSANPNAGTGTGGSMARFALYDKYLYAVTNSNMELFDVGQPGNPTKSATVNLGWGIETIFPYGKNLFIGSTTGMHIYDNSNPAQPIRLSTFQHAMRCDPVVVDGDYAYVTLQAGNLCGGGTSQLDVVDLKNLRAPKLLKSYPMEKPYGLGIDGKTLFVCDNGLKTFNAAEPLSLSQLQHFKNINAYDVIPLNGTLLLIGKDGFYQYDYSDPKALKLLSVIPVKRPDA
ncbi:MAG: hypothetical protein LH606_09210 [Cytophagaceae bacterium]|nr:hypothetical protein [Cytophagaceae bacterium]